MSKSEILGWRILVLLIIFLMVLSVAAAFAQTPQNDFILPPPQDAARDGQLIYIVGALGTGAMGVAIWLMKHIAERQSDTLLKIQEELEAIKIFLSNFKKD